MVALKHLKKTNKMFRFKQISGLNKDIFFFFAAGATQRPDV